MLSRRDVEDVGRLLTLLAEGSPYEAVVLAGSPRPVTRQTLLQVAKDELAERNRRGEVLPDGLFGEPGWEILLTLYVEQRGRRFTIAQLTDTVEIPASTMLRWLNYLQDKQLIERTAHPTDQRSLFINLTDAAIAALDIYFAERLTKVR